jgi:hypothetical protein
VNTEVASGRARQTHGVRQAVGSDPTSFKANFFRKGSPAVRFMQQIFSFPAMLGGLLVCEVFVARRDFQVDPDLWWHLKIGDSILATHHWPHTDPYSFTAGGQPWLAYEWLGDVLFAAVARAGGLRALQALLLILGAAILLTLYGYASMRAKNSKAGFLVTAVLLLLAALNFNLRPQMLGYLFLVNTLIVLERFRMGNSGALWILPPLFLLWINTHGSWEIGLGVLALYWLCGLKSLRFGDIETRAWSGEQRLRLSFTFLLCLAAIPITPYGTELAAFPFQVAFSHPLAMVHIQEWQPVSLSSFGPKLFLFLVLGTVALQTVSPRKWRLEDVLLFLGATYMTFSHMRFMLLFVPFFAPIFASLLALWIPVYNRQKDQYVLNGALLTIMLAAMVHYLPSRRQVQENVSAHFPVDAVAYMRDHAPPTPMFNTYGFGGYLVYSRGDEHKVFIDGRSELYEDGGVFADYLHVSDIQPGLLSILRNYGIQTCLLGKDEPLAVFLATLPQWKREYADDVSVIFVRRASIDAQAEPTR